MHHLAIMNREFLDKVLSGEKTIESRWSKYKRVPFGAVSEGDVIFFKLTGGKVLAKSTVSRVQYFIREADNEAIDRFVLNNLRELGLENEKGSQEFLEANNQRNYVTFIYLNEVHHIDPFDVSKEGYGVRASWIVTDDIRDLETR